MGINPLGLGGGSPTKLNSSGAQRNALDTKTTTLKMAGRRDQAQVSIGRAINQSKHDGPTTSVSRAGGTYGGSSSVTHQMAHAKRSIHDEEYTDEVRDRMRYQQIRTMMREKRAAEATATQGGSILSVGTGSGYRASGKKGIKKQLQKLRRVKPVSFGSLSDQDLDYFSSVVTPHARALSRGSRIGRSARTSMKADIEKQRRSGNITSDDAHAMKRLVDGM